MLKNIINLRKNRKLLIVSLLLMTLFVIFVLPNYISEPWVTSIPTQSEVPTHLNLLAPSTIAEKTKYRQQSQALLADIIVLRDQLQTQSVEQWADFQFQDSMSLVAVGDQHYNQGNYDQSLSSYKQALAQLQQTQQIGEDKLQQALADGELGIQSAQPSAVPEVLSAASLALVIAPKNARSQQLSRRASKFTSFVEAVQQAKKLFQKQQYQAAKKMYQQALDIDPEHQKIQTSLQSVETAINQQNFVALMSRGYTALENDNFEQALAAFNNAGAIYTHNPSIEQAIAHVSARRSQLLIDQQIAKADEYEQQGQWHQAQAAYLQLLETDSSLIQVKAKLVNASSRADLDSAITSILNDRFKLADQATYEKARKLLIDAQNIDSSDSKLQQQIEDLEMVIQRARIAVNVNLESDNLTEVALFRISTLGTFEQASVQLFPGRYIISGSRKGYRDVQVEVDVDGSPLSEAIRVICAEKI